MTELVERGQASALQLASPLFVGDTTIAGTVLETSHGHGTEWADRVIASLRPGERALVALPFRPDAAGVAHRVAIAPAPVFALVAPRLAAARHRVVELPSRAEYAARVRTALDRIAAGGLHKVVLGRSVDVVSDPPLDADAILARLLADRPGRYVFRVPLTDDLDGPVLIGASPELLVSRRGRTVRSLPLAGSVARTADGATDRHRERSLLESAKDRREHAFVVDAVVAALADVCAGVVADEPRIVSTDMLHHLGTRIGGTLAANPAGPASSALHLAQLLHPTPAIGGAPTASALQAIAELEPDRGPLTGAVGWVDADGDGEFAVAIRAGVLDGARLRLFAGAGIVAGSDPDAEVAETGAKLATMMKAVGL
ncbi:MAG: isochorismate synthase [Micropruina sp.]|uniref:isochorismate synthase n=1 Tax=Micropruina sp. TaxID=2737536 RepID=UPI0039E6CB53